MYRIINKKKRVATLVADIVGNIVFFSRLLKRRQKEINPADIRNILIVRSAYIGDVVMTLPILKPLRKRFPQAHITFLTSETARPVLENNPFIDEIITYSPFWFYPTPKGAYFAFIKHMRQKRFDIVIEARGDIRELLLLVFPLKATYTISHAVGGGGFLLSHIVPSAGRNHRVEYHLEIARFLGCEVCDAIEWDMYLSPDEQKKCSDVLAAHKLADSFFAAHPGSRVPLKAWPEDRCARLYDLLITEYCRPLVIFGAEGDRGMIDRITAGMKQRPIVMTGNLDLREFAAMVSRAGIFICNDSAPMHIAVAMKVPTVAVFGPSKSGETGPYGRNVRVVEKDFSCRFCCDETTCSHEAYHGCMLSIEPQDVFFACKDLMAALCMNGNTAALPRVIKQATIQQVREAQYEHGL
jgi:lipopolysaccharide heptosyltransferase II